MRTLFSILLSLLCKVLFSQTEPPVISNDKFEMYFKSEPLKISDLSLDAFVKNHGPDFMYGIESCITEANFPKSDSLKPGTMKRIQIFRIIKPATSQECVDFIKKQGGILPGAHGLAMAYVLIKSKFPFGFPILGFEEQKNLPTDERGIRIPVIGYYHDGRGFCFDCDTWEGGYWKPYKHFILFFSDP